MGSKRIILVGLFLFVFLIISSEAAAARELNQISGVEVVARKLLNIPKRVHTSGKTDKPPEYRTAPCKYGC